MYAYTRTYPAPLLPARDALVALVAHPPELLACLGRRYTIARLLFSLRAEEPSAFVFIACLYTCYVLLVMIRRMMYASF